MSESGSGDTTTPTVRRCRRVAAPARARRDRPPIRAIDPATAKRLVGDAGGAGAEAGALPDGPAARAGSRAGARRQRASSTQTGQRPRRALDLALPADAAPQGPAGSPVVGRGQDGGIEGAEVRPGHEHHAPPDRPDQRRRRLGGAPAAAPGRPVLDRAREPRARDPAGRRLLGRHRRLLGRHRRLLGRDRRLLGRHRRVAAGGVRRCPVGVGGCRSRSRCPTLPCAPGRSTGPRSSPSPTRRSPPPTRGSRTRSGSCAPRSRAASSSSSTRRRRRTRRPAPRPSRSPSRSTPRRLLGGHGTFIAGLIRQGCPEATILSLPVMGDDGVVEEGDLLLWLEALLDAAPARPAGSLPGAWSSTCSRSRWATTPRTRPTRPGRSPTCSPASPGAVSRSSRAPATTGAGTRSSRPRSPRRRPADGSRRRATPPVASVGACNPDGTTVALFSNDLELISAVRQGVSVVSTLPLDQRHGPALDPASSATRACAAPSTPTTTPAASGCGAGRPSRRRSSPPRSRPPSSPRATSPT